MHGTTNLKFKQKQFYLDFKPSGDSTSTVGATCHNIQKLSSLLTKYVYRQHWAAGAFTMDTIYMHCESDEHQS
jgi:hypothetical protein